MRPTPRPSSVHRLGATAMPCTGGAADCATVPARLCLRDCARDCALRGCADCVTVPARLCRLRDCAPPATAIHKRPTPPGCPPLRPMARAASTPCRQATAGDGDGERWRTYVGDAVHPYARVLNPCVCAEWLCCSGAAVCRPCCSGCRGLCSTRLAARAAAHCTCSTRMRARVLYRGRVYTYAYAASVQHTCASRQHTRASVQHTHAHMPYASHPHTAAPCPALARLYGGAVSLSLPLSFPLARPYGGAVLGQQRHSPRRGEERHHLGVLLHLCPARQ
jgi:hypothetical protein